MIERPLEGHALRIGRLNRIGLIHDIAPVEFLSHVADLGGITESLGVQADWGACEFRTAVPETRTLADQQRDGPGAPWLSSACYTPAGRSAILDVPRTWKEGGNRDQGNMCSGYRDCDRSWGIQPACFWSERI